MSGATTARTKNARAEAGTGLTDAEMKKMTDKSARAEEKVEKKAGKRNISDMSDDELETAYADLVKRKTLKK